MMAPIIESHDERQRRLAAVEALGPAIRRPRASPPVESVHDTPQGVAESRERMLQQRVAQAEAERLTHTRPAPEGEGT